MKKITCCAITILIAFISNAQNIFPASGNAGVGTPSPKTPLQVIGVSRFGSETNYASFNANGNLSFTGTPSYKVGGNKYVFRYSADPDYGLFFNSTNLRYEFRNGNGVSVFHIGADEGSGVFSSGVQIGNSAANAAGTMRWNGTNFQGYNGSSWVNFGSGVISETDPEVGANTTHFIPRWNGSALVTGTIKDSASHIAINGSISTTSRLTVYNNTGVFGTEENIALKAIDKSSSGTNTYAYLGCKLGLGIPFPGIPAVTRAGVWGRSLTADVSAAVYGWNSGAAINNYGVVATATGTGTNNYGLYAAASGGSSNHAGYFIGHVNVSNDDEALTITGSNPFVQLKNGSNLTGYVRADGTDLLLATNAENDNGRLILRTNGFNRMYIDENGNTVIGNSSVLPATGYKLSVDGKVMCEELRVELSPWADYVFEKDYKLKSLKEVEKFVSVNKRLPGIPSAGEVESKGLDVGKMQSLMMEKIEELTLYIIELNKQIEALKKQNK